jgi:hypothetical protein
MPSVVFESELRSVIEIVQSILPRLVLANDIAISFIEPFANSTTYQDSCDVFKSRKEVTALTKLSSTASLRAVDSAGVSA